MQDAAENTVNSIITEGPDTGLTLAFALAYHNALFILAANNYALARQISAENLNAIIDFDSHENDSLAIRLAYDPKGREILAAHDYELLRKLDNVTLNTIVVNAAQYMNNTNGTSVAFWLASWGPKMLEILLQEPGKQITTATLNHIVGVEPFRGTSVAFWLARIDAGRKILAANNNALARQIDVAALNSRRIGNVPDLINQSVAYWLAGYTVGRQILAADDNAILRNVQSETMNALVTDPEYPGTSVAFWLSFSAESLAAWLAADPENEILGDTLNKIISAGPYKDTSLAYMLASSAAGRALLVANNNALALAIDNEALNHIIGKDSTFEGGQHLGKSIAFWLSECPDGRAILAAMLAAVDEEDDLKVDIMTKTLNQYVKNNNVIGSVATNLIKSDDGRKILAANDYSLLTRIDYRILDAHRFAMPPILAILDGDTVNHECNGSSNCPFAMNRATLDGNLAIENILNRTENPGYTYALLIRLWDNAAAMPFKRSIYESALVYLLEKQFADNVRPHNQILEATAKRLPQLLVHILTENPVISLNAITNIVKHLIVTQKWQKDNVDANLEFVLHTLSARVGGQNMEQLYAQFYYQASQHTRQDLDNHLHLLNNGEMCYGFNTAVKMHAMLDEISDNEYDSEETTQGPTAKRLKQ